MPVITHHPFEDTQQWEKLGRKQPGKLEPKIGGTAENENETRFHTKSSTNNRERTEICINYIHVFRGEAAASEQHLRVFLSSVGGGDKADSLVATPYYVPNTHLRRSTPPCSPSCDRARSVCVWRKRRRKSGVCMKKTRGFERREH